MPPHDYIGKYIEYPGQKKVKISNIKFASGYPEHFPFPSYYEIYYFENGIEIRYINLSEDEFNEKNSIFSSAD